VCGDCLPKCTCDIPVSGSDHNSPWPTVGEWKFNGIQIHMAQWQPFWVSVTNSALKNLKVLITKMFPSECLFHDKNIKSTYIYYEMIYCYN